MKIKSISFLFGIFTILVISSCKKADDSIQLDPEVQQFNSDANSYKSELDQADNDINNFVSNTSLGQTGSGSSGSSPLCGVIMDTSKIAQKMITFIFDGVTPCFSPSRTRGGKITVELTSGNRWGDAGSVLTQTFIDYKITRLKDNKSIMFNGVKTYKNINGNNWLGFILGLVKLKYQERALGIAVTFDNNKTATWNSARITEWQYVSATTNPAIPYAHVIFTTKGDTAINSYTNVDSWGINRFSNNFISYYNAPILSNTYCGLWRFNSGEWVHHLKNTDFTLTLGLDQSGNPTPYTCAYGFKVTWTSNNKNGSVILSY